MYGFWRSVQVSNNDIRGQISAQMCSNKFCDILKKVLFSSHVAVIFGREHGSRAFQLPLTSQLRFAAP